MRQKTTWARPANKPSRRRHEQHNLRFWVHGKHIWNDHVFFTPVRYVRPWQSSETYAMLRVRRADTACYHLLIVQRTTCRQVTLVTLVMLITFTFFTDDSMGVWAIARAVMYFEDVGFESGTITWGRGGTLRAESCEAGALCVSGVCKEHPGSNVWHISRGRRPSCLTLSDDIALVPAWKTEHGWHCLIFGCPVKTQSLTSGRLNTIPGYQLQRTPKSDGLCTAIFPITRAIADGIPGSWTNPTSIKSQFCSLEKPMMWNLNPGSAKCLDHLDRLGVEAAVLLVH